jgi:NTF2 fold immunity protein of polymorphic toxin system component
MECTILAPPSGHGDLVEADIGEVRLSKTFELTLGIATFWMAQMTPNQTMSQANCNVLKIAHEYIASRYPLFDAAGLTPVISEQGSLWRLTYELPRGTLGGVPIITIDRRTCRVVRAEHTQ